MKLQWMLFLLLVVVLIHSVSSVDQGQDPYHDTADPPEADQGKENPQNENQYKYSNNFNTVTLVGINKLINNMLYAHYIYLAMEFYFDRQDVALPGLSKYFRQLSAKRLLFAERLMRFQNQRGGHIILHAIPVPVQNVWRFGVEAMQTALVVEKTLRQAVLQVDEEAGDNNDVLATNFLEGDFLLVQLETIKEIADRVTQLRRVGPGLGEALYDKHLLELGSVGEHYN